MMSSYVTQYPGINLHKALHITTQNHWPGLFFQRTHSTPWGAYSQAAVRDQCYRLHEHTYTISEFLFDCAWTLLPLAIGLFFQRTHSTDRGGSIQPNYSSRSALQATQTHLYHLWISVHWCLDIITPSHWPVLSKDKLHRGHHWHQTHMNNCRINEISNKLKQ
jgi:hypothetical protein